MQGPLGRYSVYQAIAVGEIASVHIGLLEGAEGFRRTVAIKRLIAGLVHEPAAHAELSYEACLGAFIHHPNLVSVIDLGQLENGPFLVMEYVLGETAAGLLGACGRFPVSIAVAIVVDALRGLEAAHHAQDAAGGELDIVHRNVRPENILVGVDGTARVIDFGSSVSALDSMTIPNRERSTRGADVTSPEQLMGLPVDGRADVFAAAVVLWELVVGTRPFRNNGAHQAFLSRPTRNIPPASAFNMDVSPALEEVMERALSWSPRRRFESAAQFAEALERAVAPSKRADVGAYVETMASTKVAVQRKLLGSIDAPYGRISTLPPGARRVDLAPAPAARTSSPSPLSQRNAKLARRFGELQASLSAAIRRSPLSAALQRARRAKKKGTASRREVAVTLARWAMRSRRVAARQASTVLASLSLVCLLLAATRASLGSRARPTNTPSAAELSAVSMPLLEECPPLTTLPIAPVPEVINRPIDLGPARIPEPLEPLITTKAPEPAPPVKAKDDSETTRARTSARKSAPPPVRMSCNPPFTIDEAGIRRIKPDCLK